MQPGASAKSVIVLSIVIYCTVVQAAPNDGKYNPKKYGRSGKYVHTGEGEYAEDVSRYRYVHYDDGDRGRYFHIHIPYDGGYGNYEGGHEPYRFPPYDPTGEYAELIQKYSNDPFRANSYDIQKPSIYLEYGVPAVSESNTASSVLDVRKSLLPGPGTAYLPVKEPEEDVRKSLLPGPGTAYLPVLTPEEQKLASEKRTTVVSHPNSLEGGPDATSRGRNNESVKEGGSKTVTTQNTPEDVQATTTHSAPSEDSLHNHPCFAVSGSLKLTKT